MWSKQNIQREYGMFLSTTERKVKFWQVHWFAESRRGGEEHSLGSSLGFVFSWLALLFLPSSSACPGPSQVSQWIYIPAVCQHMCVYVFVWERVCVTKSCHCAPYSYHFTISCQEQHTVQCKTNSKHWRKLFIHVFKVLHNATTIGYGKEFPRTFLTLSSVNRMCSLPTYFSLTDSSIDQKQWS